MHIPCKTSANFLMARKLYNILRLPPSVSLCMKGQNCIFRIACTSHGKYGDSDPKYLLIVPLFYTYMLNPLDYVIKYD